MEVSALRQAGLPGIPGSASLLRLQSDEHLIALIRSGNHSAFEALVSRYESRLLSFCRHMLGSREDAEDVLQEVFAAAFNALLADERDINARPWLYRIARNRCLNHMRKTAPIGVDSMDIYYADNGQSTGEKILGRERFRQLIGDVQQLPETQRTALLLREIDALSYEQIAETMETTVPSIKSLLVRARISLAEASEARALSCEEVRLTLGEAAEGLVKVSPPVRRHVRNCERCRLFRKHLRDNNHALAAIMPVAPLLMLKKLLITKLGSTAGAGHVAGASAGGATAGAGAVASAGAAASAGGGIGGIASLGAGALATKAVAGLAAAALVTAGAVEAGHVSSSHQRSHSTASVHATASAPTEGEFAPVVLRSQAQPVSATVKEPRNKGTGHHRALIAHAKSKPSPAPVPATTTVPAPAATPAVAAAPVTPVKQPPPKPPVSEVQTATTELPPTSASATTTTQTTTTSSSAPEGQQTTTTSSTAPAAPPPAQGSTPPSEPATTTPSETPPPSSTQPNSSVTPSTTTPSS